MSSDADLRRADTLPQLLELQATTRRSSIALREKRLGIWREITWEEYRQAVGEVALALDELGISAGDRVGILADNEPRWLFADLGVQTLGACTVGLYPIAETEELASALAGCRVVFCGNHELVDAVLEVREQLPALELLVVFDPRGLHTAAYANPPLLSFEGLRARGRSRADAAARHAELLAARRPDEVATVSFTPGTTGPAKGVLLQQQALVEVARAVVERTGVADRDRSVSLLPLPHVAARVFDAYAPVVAGSSVSFVESDETIGSDMAEISPTVLVLTPRLLERIRGEVEVRIAYAARVKRLAYRVGTQLLAASLTGRLAGRGRVRTMLTWLGGQLFVGRWVRAKAGLLALRHAGVACGSVAPELLRWFWGLGVPVFEQYGQVETGGVAFVQRGLEDIGTVGVPLSGTVEARIGEEGELLLRTPGLALGYSDGDALPSEGDWYATGDLGKIDEHGRLVVIDRLNHLFQTASGCLVSPAEVESKLKLSPYIATAVAIGERRPYVAALLELRSDAVAAWARRQGIAVTTYAALASDARVIALLAREVAAANALLPEPSRVRAFRVLPRPLEDELTAVGTVRRAMVEDRFADLVENLYTGEPAFDTAIVD